MIIRKTIIVLSISILYLSNAYAQLDQKISYFKLQDVELLNSPFKHAEQLNKQYLLALDADRLLAPFLREAGLPPKAESYTNWENTGLDGHIGGHYISALSLMYASTSDKDIKARLDYMIAELKRCQDANGNGYIGGVSGGGAIWAEIAEGNIRAGGFDLNGKWVPLYNIHKTYAGLRDAYLYGNNQETKEMLVKMTDWAISLVSKLTEEQIQDMLRSEHGGLNETFADVAAITGDEKYLKLAHQFSHKQILEPLLKHEDHLTGMHANTQIPKVLGFKRIADVEGNQSWSDAARYFWETVIENRSVCIGGNSVGEHFNPTDDFSRMIESIEGPETCNTYNMLRLTRMLYQTSLDKRYIDYYERALYNHILSTQHPGHGGFVYFTQMRPGHYRVYSQPQTSFWCCVGSGIENHAKYGEMIYAHTNNAIYVNLFIPSQLSWKEKKIEVVQENNFPYEAATHITVNPAKKTEFILNLRYPNWVEKGTLSIEINGKPYAISKHSDDYIAIKRKWSKGDKITMKMPMKVEVDQLPDQSNYYSFRYGPIVLAAKTNDDDLKGILADDSRGGHIAHGHREPIKDMPILISEPSKIVSNLILTDKENLHFKLNNLLSQKYGSEMELIPFYKLHDSRYIIYWPQAAKQDVETLRKQIETEEMERLKLDTITVDYVVCGEQQPESDHHIKYENSRTGYSKDKHWREAAGWFSYQLKNKGAKYLYISFLDIDKDRNFNVYINDILVTSIEANGEKENSLQSFSFPIPDSELGKETFNIMFKAQSDSRTAKIIDVRILNSGI